MKISRALPILAPLSMHAHADRHAREKWRSFIANAASSAARGWTILWKPLLPPCSQRRVRISALALLKMAMHAKSGGNLEIMGMLYGTVHDDTFVVIDAFALPVEGTETRVNAQAEAYEYMVDFAETNKARRRSHAAGACHAKFGGPWSTLPRLVRHRAAVAADPTRLPILGVHGRLR